MGLPALDDTLKKKTSLAKQARRHQNRMYKAVLAHPG